MKILFAKLPASESRMKMSKFLLCENPMTADQDGRLFILHTPEPLILAEVLHHENLSDGQRMQAERDLQANVGARLDYPPETIFFTPVWIVPQLEPIAKRPVQGDRCCYCEVSFESLLPSQRTIEHLIPRIKGGVHTTINIAECCRTCNNERGSRDLIDWAMNTLNPIIARNARLWHEYVTNNKNLMLGYNKAPLMDLQDQADNLAGIMRRMADWYKAYLIWEDAK